MHASFRIQDWTFYGVTVRRCVNSEDIDFKGLCWSEIALQEDGVLYVLAQAQDSRECCKADYLRYLQGWGAESWDRADKSLAVSLLFIIHVSDITARAPR